MKIFKCLFGRFVSNRRILIAIEYYGELIMATLAEVEADLATVNETVSTVDTKLDTVATLIQSLKDQIANGTVVTQEDLDRVAAVVTEIKTHIGAVDTEVDGLSDTK